MPRKAPPGFAGETNVPVEKSKADIERLLEKHGADGYHAGWKAATDDVEGWDLVEFVWQGKSIRFKVTRPAFSDIAASPKGVTNHTHYREQLARQRWRLLLLVIKAKLEAVEAGVAIFEEEFLAHIVTGNNKTVGEVLLPMLRAQADGRILLEKGRG